MSTETNISSTEYIINIDREITNDVDIDRGIINHINYAEDLNETMNFITNIISCVVAVINPILGLIYGILMLIPADPFKTANTTLGIVLIVVSVTTINSIVSYCVMYILMKIILIPVYVICIACKRHD